MKLFSHFRKLNRVAFFTASFLVLTPLAIQASTSVTVQSGNTRSELTQRIAEVDWNLKRSSVATRVTMNQRNESQRLLARALQEIDDGNYRTARELIRQAARPLATMSSRPVTHPEPKRHLQEVQSALVSITQGATEIARERGAQEDALRLQKETDRAVRDSARFAQKKQWGRALEPLQDRYAEVQEQVARWRDGAVIVVRAPVFTDEAQWQDSIRRMDERKQLTEYLIAEARAEEVDPAPLLEALKDADRSVTEATEQARAARWDQAYRTLDLAYARIESTWKQVGLDW